MENLELDDAALQALWEVLHLGDPHLEGMELAKHVRELNLPIPAFDLDRLLRGRIEAKLVESTILSEMQAVWGNIRKRIQECDDPEISATSSVSQKSFVKEFISCSLCRRFCTLDLDGDGCISIIDIGLLRSTCAYSLKGKRWGSVWGNFGYVAEETLDELEKAVNAFKDAADVESANGISLKSFVQSFAAYIGHTLEEKVPSYKYEGMAGGVGDGIAQAAIAMLQAQQQRSEDNSHVLALQGQISALSFLQHHFRFMILPFYIIHESVKKEHFFTLLPAFVYFGDFRRNLVLVLAASVTGCLTGLVKYMWRSPRPQWILGTSARLRQITGVTEATFATPSAHSSVLTCIASCALWNLPRIEYVIVVISAWMTVATSRMFFGVHYVQDVIIGGIIGASIGVTCMALNDALPPEFFTIMATQDQSKLVWLCILFFQVFALFVEALNRLVLQMPSPDLMEYWRLQSGVKHAIDPDSPRKTWYACGLSSGILFGLLARIYVWEGTFGFNAFSNQLGGVIWIFAIPINKYLVVKAEQLKLYFLSRKEESNKRISKRTTAFDMFRTSFFVLDVCSTIAETIVYWVIGFWTLFIFPFTIHMCVGVNHGALSIQLPPGQAPFIAAFCILFYVCQPIAFVAELRCHGSHLRSKVAQVGRDAIAAAKAPKARAVARNFNSRLSIVGQSTSGMLLEV